MQSNAITRSLGKALLGLRDAAGLKMDGSESVMCKSRLGGGFLALRTAAFCNSLQQRGRASHPNYFGNEGWWVYHRDLSSGLKKWAEILRSAPYKKKGKKKSQKRRCSSHVKFPFCCSNEHFPAELHRTSFHAGIWCWFDCIVWLAPTRSGARSRPRVLRLAAGAPGLLWGYCSGSRLRKVLFAFLQAKIYFVFSILEVPSLFCLLLKQWEVMERGSVRAPCWAGAWASPGLAQPGSGAFGIRSGEEDISASRNNTFSSCVLMVCVQHGHSSQCVWRGCDLQQDTGLSEWC